MIRQNYFSLRRIGGYYILRTAESHDYLYNFAFPNIVLQKFELPIFSVKQNDICYVNEYESNKFPIAIVHHLINT